MRFLLILTQIQEKWAEAPPGEGERIYQEYMSVERELKAQGKFVDSLRLRFKNEGKTVRNLADGKRTVVDGPFTESKESMGGLYILECASMDEALAWAQRLPNYGHGAIEIRPIWE